MNKHEVNYKHYDKERTICVSDLFEEILRKIWLVIILAVAFAVIFAGYKYMSDKSEAEKSTSTAAYEKSAAALSDEEMREVNSVVTLYEEVEALDQYLSESIRMNIDPFHEEQVVMQFSLETQYENPAEILSMLDSYIEEGPLSIDLKEFYSDIDSTYLTELVTMTPEDNILDISGAEVEAYQSNIFSVKVIHMDAESCRQLADNVSQCLSSYLDRIADYFGGCKISLIDENSFQIYDSSLRSAQTSIWSDQISQQNKITTQTGYLSDAQLEVLEAALAGNAAEEIDTIETDTTGLNSSSEIAPVKIHISKKYTLLGVLIGVAVAIVLIALYYICRGTLNVAQEMQSLFDIPVFGQLHEKEQRNPLVKAWRRLANKKKALPLETEQQIALTNLRNFCKKNQIDRILFTGTQRVLAENIWLKEVQTSLEKDQINVEIIGGLPDFPEAVEKVMDYSYVVLFEMLHSSIYKDVAREIELCLEQHIDIAGAIVVDGI